MTEDGIPRGLIGMYGFLADDADGAMTVMHGRRCDGMRDLRDLVGAYVARGRSSSAEVNDMLDERIAISAAMSSEWRRAGGARFVIADSLAASFVLTKQGVGKICLPLPSFLIELPLGFMPSTTPGAWRGTILVARHEGRLWCHLDRKGDGAGGTRVAVFDEEGDEDLRQMIQGPRGEFTDANHPSLAFLIRIVRNLASWLQAFPVNLEPRSRGSRSQHVAGPAKTSIEWPLVHLGTVVKMDPVMRRAAQSLVGGNSTYESRKMAMRHVVRGHWKQQVMTGGRKLIFVEPYWRGPDGPTAWGRTYQVQGAS